MDDLGKAVLGGDAGAILLARRSRAAALPVLRELLSHAEAPARELALLGVLEAGGPEALEACRKAALDGHPQVRAAAVRALPALLDPAGAGVLLELFDRCPDGETRRGLALAYGRMEGAAAGPLKERRAREGDARAREGLLVAAARLGDAEAQAEFLRLMEGAAGAGERAGYLELAEYIGAPWVLKGLLPYLDDLSPVLRVGADGRGEVPEHLRVRDAAAGLAVSIGRLRISSRIEADTPWEDREVEEIRSQLRRIP